MYLNQTSRPVASLPHTSPERQEAGSSPSHKLYVENAAHHLERSFLCRIPLPGPSGFRLGISPPRELIPPLQGNPDHCRAILSVLPPGELRHVPLRPPPAGLDLTLPSGPHTSRPGLSHHGPSDVARMMDGGPAWEADSTPTQRMILSRPLPLSLRFLVCEMRALHQMVSKGPCQVQMSPMLHPPGLPSVF